MEKNSRTREPSGMKSRIQFPKIDMAGVAFRLEALRSTTGLTKDAFARAAGIDPSSYTKVTNHSDTEKSDKTTKSLKSEHAFAIAERWGVTMDFIYRGDLSKIDDALRAKIMASLNNRDL